MRIPAEVASRIVGGNTLGFSCRTDGKIESGFQSGWGGGPYPPPGYLPWNVLEVGNGDGYGFYWPIGLEDDPPIVCTVVHDSGQILSVASSLTGCVRLLLRCGMADIEQLEQIAGRFDVDIVDIPIQVEDDPVFPETPNPVEFWGSPFTGPLLAIDFESPHVRYSAAKEAIARQEFDEADEHLTVALRRLPEYSEALLLRSQMLRQRRDQHGTATAIMEALTSPLCFGAPGRVQMMTWLKKARRPGL